MLNGRKRGKNSSKLTAWPRLFAAKQAQARKCFYSGFGNQRRLLLSVVMRRIKVRAPGEKVETAFNAVHV
jgi:hypothetical protein